MTSKCGSIQHSGISIEFPTGQRGTGAVSPKWRGKSDRHDHFGKNNSRANPFLVINVCKDSASGTETHVLVPERDELKAREEEWASEKDEGRRK